ncbi:hypothetical protein GCM10011369_08130 [Neiella marina]|uniref:Uncharacterized protein n=2 Tax=Neiella marina TaxID=508461 RepID=A0A8J2XMZ2_9GAMM|nr:hypothetical protein GCM10011369_08130 [Neiella marina]
MTKLLSSSGVALMLLALVALGYFASHSMALSFQAMIGSDASKPDTEPPNSGYPPLFITTQRLLN